VGRSIKHILPSLLISVVFSGAILIAFKYDVFEGVERRLFDYRLRARGQLPLSDQVAIAVISEESLGKDELGMWPWPRAYQGYLVDALSEYGAKVIGYDVFFPEPDENVPLSGLRQFMRGIFVSMGLDKPDMAQSDQAKFNNNLREFYQKILGAEFVGESQTAEKKVDEVVEHIDPDKKFSKVLTKHDNVILGYYFMTPISSDKLFSSLEVSYKAVVNGFKGSGPSLPPEVKQVYKGVRDLLEQLDKDQEASVPYSQRLKEVISYISNFENSEKQVMAQSGKLSKKKIAALERFYNNVEQQILIQIRSQLVKQNENPDEEARKAIAGDVAGMEKAAVHVDKTSGSVDPFLRASTLKANIPDFTQNTKHFGHVTVEPDPDGVIRYNLIGITYGNYLFPSLSVEVAALFKNAPLSVILMPYGIPPVMKIGNQDIPLDEEGRLLINYHGARTYPEYDIFYIIRSNPELTNFPFAESIPLYFKEVLKKTPEEYFQELNGREPKEGEIDGMIYSEMIDNEPIARKIVKWESENMFFNKYGITPKQAFENKVVLVGATATGIYDMRVTPFSENYPGVEIHAQVIDSILNSNFIQRPTFYGIYGLAMIIGFAIVLGIVIPLISAVRGAILIIALAIGLISLDFFYFFTNKGWWMPLICQSIQMGAVYFAVTIYRYATEEREKRWIKDTFGRYLAPSVVEELTKNPEMVKLGGESLQMTAFFSDIQGFSTISEKLGSAQLLVELLNDYLSVMAHVIESYEGTVDKYEGDAIIAFWGAPVHFPDHAVKACFACLEQQVKLAELREKWKKEGGWPEIVHNARVRMGLNTGEMVVGNMGSAGRMNYTIMGDAVNLASRLEGANKPYGTFIMISEYTYAAAKDHIEVRELDSLRVVGKTEPVRVYELLARKGQLEPQKQQLVSIYNEGLVAYRAREWDISIEKFSKALQLDPYDGPSKAYRSRCEDFKLEPPGPEWDGVYTLKSK